MLALSTRIGLDDPFFESSLETLSGRMLLNHPRLKAVGYVRSSAEADWGRIKSLIGVPMSLFNTGLRYLVIHTL